MNKPVAWMMVNRENTSAYLTFEKPTRDMKISHEPTPLYTHPHSEESVKVKELKNIVVAYATCSCGKVMEVTNLQPVKELTDEEIWDFIEEHMGFTFLGRCYRHSQFNMCKAILRKAQEK